MKSGGHVHLPCLWWYATLEKTGLTLKIKMVAFPAPLQFFCVVLKDLSNVISSHQTLPYSQK